MNKLTVQVSFILMILIISVNILASSQVVVSDVMNNTTWDTDTVFIEKEDFCVQTDARLAIMPGTVVLFMKGLRFLRVNGTITADGTEADSIYFFHENSEVLWQGIRLLKRVDGFSGYDSSSIKFCILAGARCVDTDSSFMKKGAAVYCGPGNYLELNNCKIVNNRGYYGGAVYVDSGSIVDVNKCLFNSNTAEFYGGGAVITDNRGVNRLTVRNCRFNYNYARAGGAVRIGNGATVEITNSIFYRDTTLSINPDFGDLKGGAIAVFGPADITIRGSIFFFCRSWEKGGAIYNEDASIKLINCTLAQNSALYGGGIYFGCTSNTSSPTLVNTIECVNGRIPSSKIPCDSAGCGIFIDSAVTPVFRYCHLNDTIYDHTTVPYQGEYDNCQYLKTDFVYRTAGFDYSDTVVEGYQLASRFSGNDPGIDGGTPDTTGLGLPEFDVLGQKRIFGDAVDVGAIEYNDTFLTVKSITEIRKPLRFSGGAYNGAVIYSLNGRKMESFTGTVSMHTIRELAGRKLPKGVYLIAVRLPDKQRRLDKLLVK
jgi:hypothetical protein